MISLRRSVVAMFDIDFYDGKSVFSQLNVCIFANLRYKNEFRMMICWNDIAMNFIYYLSIAVQLFHLSIFIYMEHLCCIPQY